MDNMNNTTGKTGPCRTKLFFFALFSFLFLLSLPALTYAQATVVTDKPDYPPGSVVTILGSGFVAGETVTVQVTCVDGTHNLTSSSTADASGAFTNTAYTTVAADAGTLLTVTATGGTSARTAQTTFTDTGQATGANGLLFFVSKCHYLRSQKSG